VLKSISASQLFQLQGVIVDVRSESEFADAHVPGAVNVPLLNDAERTEIGTLYKRQGSDFARRRGLEIVAPKLSALFDGLTNAISSHCPPNFEAKRPDTETWQKVLNVVAHEIMVSNFGADEAEAESSVAVGVECERRAHEVSPPFTVQSDEVAQVPLTLYCWRGGARSKSMTLFARSLGFNAQFVAGGHKSFRNEVLNFIEAGKYPFKFCTLYGLTGAGKTQVLRQWLSEGKPVIDLEALAHHRGSAFGQVGIDTYGKQKEFENNLYWEMKKLEVRGEKIVFLEGESRRIGRVQLPQAFMDAMMNGLKVKMSQSVEERVQNILGDYVAKIPEERVMREARVALEAIKRRLGGEKFKELNELLEQKQFAKFTEVLLVDYYDKLYQFSRAPDDFYAAFIHDARDWERLNETLLGHLEV
jgi:tRNA 2-selenouridine synthase